jgi:hypothetical protein
MPMVTLTLINKLSFFFFYTNQTLPLISSFFLGWTSFMDLSKNEKQILRVPKLEGFGETNLKSIVEIQMGSTTAAATTTTINNFVPKLDFLDLNKETRSIGIELAEPSKEAVDCDRSKTTATTHTIGQRSSIYRGVTRYSH